MLTPDFLTAIQLVDLMRSGEITPLELMQVTLERINALNPVLNAFVALRGEQALAEAEKISARIAAGEKVGPLAGIPIAVKDMEDVEGLPTTYGSALFKNNVAQCDSVQVARLKAAGAIVVGKTNVPEFGYTAFTKNRLYGLTRNPWNPERTPGGSSGGSAAAVAAGMVPLATGSDAGGSIRIPASYCGCFGLKPSFGRIPFGTFPLVQIYQMMVCGPITRSVADAALYLDCAAGYHPADPGSAPAPGFSYLKCLNDAPQRLRIAYSPSLGYAQVQSDVAAVVERAAGYFTEMGHTVEICGQRLPDVAETWGRLMDAEIYCQLHEKVKHAIDQVGRSIQRAFYGSETFSMQDQLEAQKVRTALNTVLGELFAQYDLLITPTMPTEAFAAGGPPPAEINGHPIAVLQSVAFTYPFNLSGHPAATIPVGFTTNDLPVGMQIIAPRYRDDLLLQMAHQYEQVRPWNTRRPAVSTQTGPPAAG